MKKFSLLLLLPLFVQSQILTSTDKGYLFVWVGDTIASQHTKQSTALSKAYQFKLEQPNQDVKITYPTTEINVKRDDLKALLEEDNVLDLGTTIVEPLPNNPVIESVTLVNDVYIIDYRLSEGSEVPEGGFDAYVDGVDQNNHDYDYVMEISGLDTSIQHCFFLEARYTQSEPFVFPQSNEVCYPENDTNMIEIIDVVLDDFNGFDVVVSDTYKNVLGECKQGEIKDIEGIETYDKFYVRYKHPAYSDIVSRMKVENGNLIGL